MNVVSCLSARLRVVVAMAVLVSVTACKESSDNPDLVIKHLKQAESYLKQGQYKAANIEVRNASQKDPRSLEAIVLGATIMAELGFHTQVIETLSAIEDKLNAEGLFILAEAYLGRTKYRSTMGLLDRKSVELQVADKARFQTVQGNALLGRGEYEKALLAFRQVITPNKLPVGAGIGEVKALSVLERLDERDKRLKALKAAAPNYSDVLMLDARILVSRNNLDQAETALTQALSALPSADEMTPRRAAVISLLADILSKQKRSAEALRYSRILSEAYPGMDEAQGLYQQALTLFRESKLEEAEALLQQVLEQSPQFESASQLLGVINFLQGDHKEADQLFADALDPELASDQVKQVYALNSMRLQRPNEVLSVLEDGIADSKNPKIWAMYGVALQSVGRIGDAIKALQRSLALDGKQARVHLVLAQYLAGQSKPKMTKALTHFQKANELAPADPLIQKNLLQHFLRTNNRAAADAFAKQVQSSAEKSTSVVNPDTWVLLGDYALFASQQNKAMALYQQASDYPKAAAQLALTYIRAGKVEEAKTLCRNWQVKQAEALWSYRCLLGLARDDKSVKSRLVRSFEKQAKESDGELSAPLIALGFQALDDAITDAGQVPIAIAYAKKAKAFATKHPELDRLLAASFYAQAEQAVQAKRYDDARTSILSGLQAMPESTPLLIALADVEISSDNLSEAKKIVDQVKLIDQATGLHLEGDVYVSKTNFKAAQESYAAAWALRPSDNLAAQLYRSYQTTQANTQANTLLKNWLERFPGSARARAISGTQLLSKNDFVQAAQEFERGLQDNPNSVVLLNNLAWVQQQRKQNNAEPLAARAAELAPNSAAVLDTYGWILLEKGKAKQALPILEKAHELAPDNAEIKEHLTLAREKQ